MMRQSRNSQYRIGDIPIGDIQIDVTSRDDIPSLLLGLQHLYINQESRSKLFSILETEVNQKVDDLNANKGRPGMTLWRIFVLGVFRLCLNCDYDRLQELANNHKTIRQMLEHGDIDSDYQYKLQTIKDNVSLLTPAILDKINQVVINEGHKFVQHDKDKTLTGRCDSFVVETNVDYPTDIKLLGDAIRKVITLIAALCSICGISDWVQYKHHKREIKKAARKAQLTKRSKSKDEAAQQEQDKQIVKAYQDYINIVLLYINKALETISKIDHTDIIAKAAIPEIRMYLNYAMLEIEQMRRRVVDGEVIPNDEKIFSVFEEHTEWISKGKAGVPFELGLKVCIIEDQHGFILHHMVMQNETDDKVAVSMIKECQSRFSNFKVCSFDKGFHSPSNQIELTSKLDCAILPKKGTLSKKDKDRQFSDEFIKGRRQHSAVESAINCLEVHGLDRCPDCGLIRFYSYIALGVVGRNLHQLGAKIRNAKRKELKEEFIEQAA